MNSIKINCRVKSVHLNVLLSVKRKLFFFFFKVKRKRHFLFPRSLCSWMRIPAGSSTPKARVDTAGRRDIPSCKVFLHFLRVFFFLNDSNFTLYFVLSPLRVKISSRHSSFFFPLILELEMSDLGSQSSLPRKVALVS